MTDTGDDDLSPAERALLDDLRSRELQGASGTKAPITTPPPAPPRTAPDPLTPLFQEPAKGRQE